jgi:hypothetical protein
MQEQYLGKTACALCSFHIALHKVFTWINVPFFSKSEAVAVISAMAKVTITCTTNQGPDAEWADSIQKLGFCTTRSFPKSSRMCFREFGANSVAESQEYWVACPHPTQTQTQTHFII